jgi:hypothetical protein
MTLHGLWVNIGKFSRYNDTYLGLVEVMTPQ